MASWAGTLPEYLPINAAESSDDNLIRTEMDMGPRKVRRRFTALVRFIDVPGDGFILTGTQKDALLTFHDSTCKHGSLPFNWVSNGPTPEFDNDTTTEFRFDGRPLFQMMTPGPTPLYQVSMRLEILP